MKSKLIKINWNKPGGTASASASKTAKISIPASMLKALQMMEEENLVISLEDGYIRIEKDMVKINDLIEETLPSGYAGQDLETLVGRIQKWSEKLQDGRTGDDRKAVRGNLKDDLAKMATLLQNEGKDYKEEMKRILNFKR